MIHGHHTGTYVKLSNGLYNWIAQICLLPDCLSQKYVSSILEIDKKNELTSKRDGMFGSL